MFVLLALLILYPNTRLTEFAKAMKTSRAAKLYWRALNSKRSNLLLEWASESEKDRKKVADIYNIHTRHHDRSHNPCCACAHGVTMLLQIG